MALTPEENAAFYYGNPPAKTDYLSYLNPTNYNVFGVNNPSYTSLLGQPQADALSKQSNVAGLLGAAAALAQGMTKGGPRRSAVQNILGALGAGYGASGQAYQQGLQNFSTSQQLQANAEKQKAFADMATKYPDLAPLARLDPGKFVEMVSQLEQQRPITEAYRQAQQPNIPVAPSAVVPSAEMAAYKEQMRPYTASAGVSSDGGIAGVAPTVMPQAAPVVGEPTTQLAAGTVETAPVPDISGRVGALPTAPAPAPAVAQVNPKEQALRNQIDTLFRVNENLSKVGTTAANSEIKNNLEQIKSLNTQLQQVTVSGIDLTEFKNSLPENFRGQADNLDKLAKKGLISGNEVRVGMQQISDKAADYQQKLNDRTNDVIRTAAELFPETPLHKLDQKQTKALNEELLVREQKLRRSGATNLSVYGDKVLAGERAKSQSKAEENAINAQNSASDVRAIVDVLKPYRGGALQDFAGSIGAYLPGTELEKLATTKQVAEAIRAKLAPTLRVEGSGATSDLEIKAFTNAIPSLFNTAQGRELLAVYSEKLANRAIAAADIRARLVESGTFTVKKFQDELAKAGLARVFTPEDLQNLQANKPAAGGVRLSTQEGQSAYEKYKPR